MNINEFNQEFCDALQEAIAPEGGKIYAVSIPKNNELLDSLTLRFNDDPIGVVIYPATYFEDYENGAKMDEIIDFVKNTMAHQCPEIELETFNREAAPEHLQSAIVGYDKNKEWLKDIPHERVSDIAIFAKWHLGEQFSIKVTASMLALMQMTKEEMLQIAKSNTAKDMDFKNMNEVMKEIMVSNGMDVDLADAMMQESGRVPLHVLSTKNGIDGAALIADTSVLKEIYEQLGEDFYILPSSIHETIILPKSEANGDVEELKEMVTMINSTEVPIQDQLTDNVYEFDSKGLKIAGATENLKVDPQGINNTIKHRR